MPAWHGSRFGFVLYSARICLDGKVLFQKHYGDQNTDDGNKGDDDDEVEDEDYWDHLDENEADYDPDEDFQGKGFESWCEQVIVAERDRVVEDTRHGGHGGQGN